MDIQSEPTLDIPVLNSGYKVHIGSGGIPIEILFPGEYCSFFVGCHFVDWSSREALTISTCILQHFSKFGCITQFQRFSADEQAIIKHPCFIRMESKAAALKAVENGNLVVNGDIWEVKPVRHIWPEQIRTDRRLESYELILQFRRHPVMGFCNFELRCSNILAVRVIEAFAAHVQPWSGFRIAQIVIPDDVGKLKVHESYSSINRIEVEKEKNSAYIFKLMLIDVEPSKIEEHFIELFSPLFLYLDVTILDVFLLRHSLLDCLIDDLDELRIRTVNYIKSLMLFDNLLRPQFFNSDAALLTGSKVLPFNVHIQRSGDNGELNAVVIFQNANAFNALSKMMMQENHLLKLSHICKKKVQVNVEPCVRLGYVVTKELLLAVMEDIWELDKELRMKRHARIAIISAPCELFLLCIEAETVRLAEESLLTLEKVIHGEIIDRCECRFCSSFSNARTQLPYCKLFTRAGRDFLFSLKKEFGESLVITFIPVRKEVKIQGSKRSIQLAVKQINDFLRGWNCPTKLWCIPLSKPEFPQCFVDLLCRENQLALKLLEIELGEQLTVKGNELEFFGTKRQLDELTNMVHDFANVQRDPGEKARSMCVVCHCSIRNEAFHLQNCGHLACKSCLYQQIHYALRTRSFPIECAACQTKFSVNDLKNIFLEDETCSQNPQRWQLLAEAALTYYINKHLDKFFYCSTPNCFGIYKRSETAVPTRCSVCEKTRCSRCGEESHGALSCEQRMKIPADSFTLQWLREDKWGRRMCPNCQSPIEKVGGCYHVECPICKKHFCWACSFLAESSRRIYEHLKEVHKSSGTDLQRLIDEFLNGPEIAVSNNSRDGLHAFDFSEATQYWQDCSLYTPSFESLILDDTLDAKGWSKGVA